MHKCLLAIVLGVAVIPGCNEESPKPVDQSPKTVEQLAAEAQREIEILTPSLEKAAQDVLVDIEPRAAQYEGKCGLVWETEEGGEMRFVAPAELVISKDDKDSPWVFVSQKGERLAEECFNTKEIYSLTAVEKSYRFKFRGIQRIIRTGVIEAPFAGVAEFDVIHSIRTSSRSQDIPLPIPEHYRLPRKGDIPEPPGGGFRRLRVIEAEEVEDWDILEDESYPSLRPFNVSAPDDEPREKLPEEVQAVVDELFEDCRSSEAMEYTRTQTVGFRYWVAEKKWDWRTDQERARDAELAKQSASDENAADEKPKK